MRAIVVAALVMVAAALFAPAASHAAAPCWQRVLDDWRDGRIDGEYSVHCYRDALSHLPEDLRVYGSAQADIQRALTRELAERSTQARPGTRAVATTQGSTATSTAVSRPKRRTLAVHTSKRPKAKQPAGRRAAAPATASSDSSAFPVKLVLVFGGAALVAAVALASVGRAAAVRRRRQDG